MCRFGLGWNSSLCFFKSRTSSLHNEHPSSTSSLKLTTNFQNTIVQEDNDFKSGFYKQLTINIGICFNFIVLYKIRNISIFALFAWYTVLWRIFYKQNIIYNFSFLCSQSFITFFANSFEFVSISNIVNAFIAHFVR